MGKLSFEKIFSWIKNLFIPDQPPEPVKDRNLGWEGSIIPEFLKDTGVSTDDHKEILHLAASYGRLDIVKAIAGQLYKDLDFSKEKDRVRILAAENGHIEIIEFCDSLVNPNGH